MSKAIEYCSANTSKVPPRPAQRLTPLQPRQSSSALLRTTDSSEGPEVPLAAGGGKAVGDATAIDL